MVSWLLLYVNELTNLRREHFCFNLVHKRLTFDHQILRNWRLCTHHNQFFLWLWRCWELSCIHSIGFRIITWLFLLCSWSIFLLGRRGTLPLLSQVLRDNSSLRLYVGSLVLKLFQACGLQWYFWHFEFLFWLSQRFSMGILPHFSNGFFFCFSLRFFFRFSLRLFLFKFPNWFFFGFPYLLLFDFSLCLSPLHLFFLFILFLDHIFSYVLIFLDNFLGPWDDILSGSCFFTGCALSTFGAIFKGFLNLSGGHVFLDSFLKGNLLLFPILLFVSKKLHHRAGYLLTVNVVEHSVLL